MPSFAERRAANIQANNAELSKINAAKKLRVPKAEPKPRPSRARARSPRVKTEPVRASARPVRTTRQSARLLEQDTSEDGLKRKAESEADIKLADPPSKKLRRSEDMALGALSVDGKKWQGGFAQMKELGLGIPVRGAQPGFRTFTDEHVTETTDQQLKELRLRMNGLKLYEKFPVADLKIVPQRIYSMAFHPTEEKAVIFAGDKEGALGIFDASQDAPADEDDEEDEEVGNKGGKRGGPVMSALPIHARTITGIQFDGDGAKSVYTSSYDSSIRRVDLVKEVSTQVVAPEEVDEDMPISSIEIACTEPSVIYFTTLAGLLGKHDVRTKPSGFASWSLTDHKIGGFSLHPAAPHLLATASLDRFMRIWDTRMLGPNGKMDRALVGEHQARLSVSHASWSSAGHVATSSYDDKIRVHSFPDAGTWRPGHGLTGEAVEPTAVIPHNNQTGRWVTILKPQWQRRPRDGIPKFVIGNMNRFVDVYDASGEQLAQLDGDGITAVPAVAHFHPTMDWVAGGNASGKLCLWQ